MKWLTCKGASNILSQYVAYPPLTFVRYASYMRGQNNVWQCLELS
jgi:hypothetical protein